MQLARPSVEYKSSFLEAVREFQAEGNYPELNMPQLERYFESHVRGWLARETSPPPGLVPESIFWMIDGDRFVGRISIRHRLNESLREFGGHIGYEVRPSRRREGHGTAALGLALVEARKLGLDRVLITCDTTNIGSRRIIEANGGVLEDIIQNSFRDVPTMRWWISIESDIQNG